MSLIKFPSQIKPSRVTINLQRSDEVFISPVTGVQQSVSRGGSFWRWTYEYKDLSESERDIVQAFLVKCRGSLNPFKAQDPGDYEIAGDISSWSDVFSGYGSFVADTESSTTKLNSYFIKSSRMHGHITDEQLARFEWWDRTATANLQIADLSIVKSLEVGKAYVQQIKFFQHPERVASTPAFRVGSGGGSYVIQSPYRVESSDSISFPFITGNDLSSWYVGVIDWTKDSKVGDHWGYADYRLARCALVSNSENLFTHSNNFGDADWTKSRCSADSGGMTSPDGVGNGAWKLFVDTTSNTHGLTQSVTKVTTEDIYTAAFYAKAAEIGNIRIYLDDGTGGNNSYIFYYLNSGTTAGLSNAGSIIRPYGAMFDVGSGWYRCQMTAVVSSLDTVRSVLYLVNDVSQTSFDGNGSDGIWVANAQMRKFPFPGQYVPTSDTIVVGSGWQTGANLFVDGLDPLDVIKAGTRLEVVNQFNRVSSSTFQRSEFKRITEEIVVHREGWAILPVDPPIRNAPVTDRSSPEQQHVGETMHNPVIFSTPELKARLVAGTVQYIDKPLKLTDIVFDVIEDLTE